MALCATTSPSRWQINRRKTHRRPELLSLSSESSGSRRRLTAGWRCLSLPGQGGGLSSRGEMVLARGCRQRTCMWEWKRRADQIMLDPKLCCSSVIWSQSWWMYEGILDGPTLRWDRWHLDISIAGISHPRSLGLRHGIEKIKRHHRSYVSSLFDHSLPGYNL